MKPKVPAAVRRRVVDLFFKECGSVYVIGELLNLETQTVESIIRDALRRALSWALLRRAAAIREER